MSKVEMNPVFEGFRRKMGDLVFFKLNGKTYAKRRSTPANPNTPAQQSVRRSFTYVAELWKGSRGVMRNSWERAAKSRKISAYNAFLAENSRRRRGGLPLELTRELGEEALAGFTAQTGGSAGQVSLSFTMPAGAAEKHLTVFAQDGDPAAEYAPLRRYDLGAGALSPVTVDGLEAGKPYFLYGVLSNAAYPGAGTVSASVAADAVAGS
jgi:hypothetical protein